MLGFLNFSSSNLSLERPGDRLRVLVAEDHIDLSRIITWMLRHCGFDVQAVLDGLQILPTARSFKPHFILLDIGLPGLDGYQAAELIRDDPELNDIIIIAISAYAPDVPSCRNRRSCFDHHLTKPVDIKTILPLLVPRQS